MSMPNKDSFENLIREKVEGHEFSYTNDAWARMQKKLEVKKPGRGFRFGKNMQLFALAVLIFLAGFAGYEYRRHQDNENSTRLAVSHAAEKPAVSNLDITKDSHQPGIMNSRAETKTGAFQLRSTLPLNISGRCGTLVSKNVHHLQRKSDDGFQHMKNEGLATNNNFTNNSLLNNNIDLKQESISNKTDSYMEHGKKAVSNDSAQNHLDKTLTANQTKTIPQTTASQQNKEYKEPEKNPISFGPFIGFNTTFDMQGTSVQSGYSILQSSLGAFINFPLSDKFSLQSGFAYNQIGSKMLWRSDTTLKTINSYTS